MRSILLTPLLLGLAGGALAADPQPPRDLRVRVGLGSQLKPKYPGADSQRVAALPSIDIAKGDDEFDFGAPDDGLGIPLIKSGRFTLGPSAAIANGRKDKDVGVPLGRVKSTIELGGFAQVELTDSLRLRGFLRKGLNGHDGLVGDLGVDKIWRNGDRYVFSLGPRVLWSDAKYQRAYFGVSRAAALATGLPAYDPGSGIHAVALQGGGLKQFGKGPFGLFGIARYERLVGDAAKSPVVRQLGSRNQYTVGLGLSYTFRVKR
jgi:outer membrane protein